MDHSENPWIIRNSRQVYDNPWIGLTEHQVITPGGNDGIYGIVHFKNIAIGILPLDHERHTWLVGQYRLPLGEYSWEIPEGGGHPDIDPLESAKRELLEETGLKAEKWREIQRISLSNSVTDERGIIYLAEVLTQYEPEPEDTEQLILKRIPFEEAYQLVINGTITDSLSVAGILRVKLMLEKDEL
jgi:8-oxo-dGTP pyrophosphatase MutT (NUDIX family)